MGVQIKVAGTDRSSSYSPEELAAIRIELSAFDGEVGQGSIPVPVASPFEAYAGQRFEVIDTFSGSVSILDGFVGGHQRERGTNVGGRMNLVHALSDDNALLYGFRAYRWTRPSESTRARFLAFIVTFVPAVTDTTWVTATKTATMPAKVYTTEGLFSELAQDIEDLTGNTCFIEHRRAHCHPFTEGITGGLAISDTTYNYSTSFPPDAATGPSRTKDPMDLGNDVMVKTPSGVSTKTDATSIGRHDSAGLRHQRYVDLPDGSASAQATEILLSSKNERITYECDIGPLTAAQVDSIPVGCLVNVTSAVMGLSASTQRIAHISLSYRNAPSGRSWMAHLEFGYPVRIRVKPPRTAAPVAALPPYIPGIPGATLTCPYEMWDTESVPPSGSDLGNGWAVITGDKTKLSFTSGAVIHTSDSGIGGVGTVSIHQIVTPSDSAWAGLNQPLDITYQFGMSEPGAVLDSFVDIIFGVAWSAGGGGSGYARVSVTCEWDPFGLTFVSKLSLTHEGLGSPIEDTIADASFATGGLLGIVLHIGPDGLRAASGPLSVAAPGYTEHPGDATVSITHSITFDNFSETAPQHEILVAGPIDISDGPWCFTIDPVPGQEVKDPPVTGDGSTTGYATGYPYAPGSLRVETDGLPDKITETDPTTGAFTFDTAPQSDEVFIAYYNRSV